MCRVWAWEQVSTESSPDLLELVRIWSEPNNMAVNNSIFGSSCKSSKVASALNCWATTPATYNALTTKGRVLLYSPEWTRTLQWRMGQSWTQLIWLNTFLGNAQSLELSKFLVTQIEYRINPFYSLKWNYHFPSSISAVFWHWLV